MDARPAIVAPADPPEAGAETRKRVVHHAIAQGRSPIGDEECLDGPIADATPTGLRIAR